MIPVSELEGVVRKFSKNLKLKIDSNCLNLDGTMVTGDDITREKFIKTLEQILSNYKDRTGFVELDKRKGRFGMDIHLW